MGDLKKNKPKLSELSKLQSNVENFDHGTNLQEKRNELRDQMAILYNKKTQIQDKMKALNEKRQRQVGDMSEVMEKREAIQKKVAELIGEKKSSGMTTDRPCRITRLGKQSNAASDR